MRYVEARLEESNREEAYRIYVSKTLQLIPQGKFISIDYRDMLKPQMADTRSGDEILLDVMSKAGLKFEE